MEHIKPNIGNILFITAVSGVGIMATLAMIHYLSGRDIPVASPAARGMVDVIQNVAAA